MARDGYTAVSAYLGAGEAEMLRGVLESAGIEVVVEGEAIASLSLPQAVGGATILVPDADAGRAREIVAASGVFPGAAPDRAEEIDEAEWGAGSAEAEPEVELPPPGPAALARRALGAALLGTALCFTMLVPLYALTLAARFYRAARGATRGDHLRAAAAALLVALSLSAGVAFWVKVAPDLRSARHGTATRTRGLPLPAPGRPQPPRPPFP